MLTIHFSLFIPMCFVVVSAWTGEHLINEYDFFSGPNSRLDRIFISLEKQYIWVEWMLVMKDRRIETSMHSTHGSGYRVCMRLSLRWLEIFPFLLVVRCGSFSNFALHLGPHCEHCMKRESASNEMFIFIRCILPINERTVLSNMMIMKVNFKIIFSTLAWNGSE